MSTQRGNKNSDAIRILQRDRDASARATHLKAEIGMVPNSTIERKIMSTKTSIKRIALVAAAALTIGGFTAVSAHAADNATLKFKAGDGAGASPFTTGNGVAGPGNAVTVDLNRLSGYDLYVSVTGGTIASSDDTYTVVASNGLSASRADQSTDNNSVLTIPTPSVGTITLNLYTKATGTNVYGSTVAETVVITVGTTASSGKWSAAKTTAYIIGGQVTTSFGADSATTVSLNTAQLTTESATATILVTYLDGLGAAITSSAQDTLTATITSGPGTIASTDGSLTGVAYDSTTVSGAATTTVRANDAAAKYTASVRTNAFGEAAFFLFANGQAGVTTVTIKNTAGDIVATKSWTFTSTTIASITATVNSKNVTGDAGAPVGVVNTKAVSLVLKDSAGNLIVGGACNAITPTSSSTTYLGNGTVVNTTSDSSGICYYTAAPVAGKYGPATITFSNAAGTVKATADLVSAALLTSSLAITAPASAGAGEKMTYTLTAKDAAGNPIADGVYPPAWFVASFSGSAAVYPSDPFAATESITVTAGVGTDTVYAPATASYVASWTLEGTALTADTHLSKALAATVVTATTALTSIGGDSSLAYDAASAATDAANNAYEEAQNATQAASDALAAVKALAVQVKALIALVNKIKAKLKA